MPDWSAKLGQQQAAAWTCNTHTRRIQVWRQFFIRRSNIIWHFTINQFVIYPTVLAFQGRSLHQTRRIYTSKNQYNKSERSRIQFILKFQWTKFIKCTMSRESIITNTMKILSGRCTKFSVNTNLGYQVNLLKPLVTNHFQTKHSRTLYFYPTRCNLQFIVISLCSDFGNSITRIDLVFITHNSNVSNILSKICS